MKKETNTYIIIYTVVMVVIVAVLLSVAALALQGRQQANIDVEKQGAILASVGLGQVQKGDDKTAVIKLEFKEHIVAQLVIDAQGNEVEGVKAFDLLSNLKAEYAAPTAERRLPLFVAQLSDGQRLYVIPVYGAGLWGPIWGYIALETDMDTIYGVSFDHKSETPGLGAEIASAHFRQQFVGKKLFSGDDFVAISVMKGVGASAGNDNAVDAVSGGTITSRGVQSMLHDCLSDFLPYFNRVRAEEQLPAEGEDLPAEPQTINNQNE